MADKTLKVVLSAKDDASATFKKLGDSAKTLGQSLEDAGKNSKTYADAAKQATIATEDLGDAAGDTSQSMRNIDFKAIEKDANQFGQAIGVVVIGMGLAGASFRDQEIAIGTLQRSYGDATDEMLAFTNQIQDTTNYSNDAALESANIAATLARNYGFSAQEIQNVLQISADLAATSGLSLADATQRVTAALRGEAEGAEVLGLTMNQAAIDSNNLTLSMSNQEAGHFRLNALYQQAAFAQGAAAVQADSFYGKMTQLKDSVQDAAQSFGGFLGPLGELGAFAGDNALALGGMALGLRELGQGAVGLGKLLSTTSTAMTGVGLASNALSLALGPVGIVAAAGAAVVGVGLLGRYLSDEYNSAVDEADTATQSFTDNLIALGQAGTLSMLNQAVAQRGLIISQYGEDLAAADEDTHNFIESMKTLETGMSGPGSAINARTKEVTDALSESQIAFIDGIQMVNGAIVQGNEDGILSFEELQLAIDNTDQVMANTGETAQAYAEAWDSAQGDIAHIMSDTTDAGVEAQQKLLDVMKAVMDGNQQMGGAAKTIATISDDMDAATASAVATGEAFENTSGSVVKWLDAGGRVHTLNDGIATSMQDLGAQSVILGDDIDTSGDALKRWLDAGGDVHTVNFTDDIATSMQDLGEQSVALGPHIDEATDALKRWLDAGGDIHTVNFTDDIATSMQDLGEQSVNLGVGFTAGLRNMTEAASDFQDMMQSMVDTLANAPDAAETLDRVFNSIVGNTNKIASGSQAVADWATGMSDASEGASRLDEILVGVDNGLSAATISQTEYNDAMDAFTTIGQENAEIQQNIAVIQAKQAPLLADQIEMTENYTQAIADMPAAQAAVALGFMDAAQSGHALELQTLAISAATGELGAGGKDFATNVIVGAAQADLQLQAMLVSMNLISVDKEGNITVNFDDNATGPLEQLNETMEKLAYTQLLIIANGDTTAADAAFEELFGKAAEWDNTESTAGLHVQNEDALTGVQEAQNQVDTFGRSSGTAQLHVQAEDALDGTNQAQNAVGEFDRSTGTAGLGVADNASGTISYALGLLNQFDGRNSYSTITTQFVTIGSPPGAAGARYAHGGVPGYATGGVVAELAEWGPELAHFATGGTMPIMDRGLYEVPMNTYISPNNTQTAGSGQGVTINISVGDVNGYDDFATRLVSDISKGLQRANSMYERGMGW